MTTIETIASITDDHRLIVDTTAPDEVPSGRHRVIVLIQEPEVAPESQKPLTFSNYDVRLATDQMTFRREDLYDDIR